MRCWTCVALSLLAACADEFDPGKYNRCAQTSDCLPDWMCVGTTCVPPGTVIPPDAIDVPTPPIGDTRINGSAPANAMVPSAANDPVRWNTSQPRTTCCICIEPN